jgi:hypothetical protein
MVIVVMGFFSLLELANDLAVRCEDRLVYLLEPGVETELGDFVVEPVILPDEEEIELARPTVVCKDEPEDFQVDVCKETVDVSLLWDEERELEWQTDVLL